MIDYKLENGDLIKKGEADIQIIAGIEAKKQSMLIRLTIERGTFLYDELLGSRLKLLYREKKSQVPVMAEVYVREALELEEDIVITKVDVKWIDKTKILVVIFFIWNEISYSMEAIV